MILTTGLRHVEPELVSIVGHLLVRAQDWRWDVQSPLVIGVGAVGRFTIFSTPLVTAMVFVST